MENLALGPEKYYLGQLCCKGHDWQNSGESLRLKGDRHCASCRRECSRSRSEYGKQWYEENRDRHFGLQYKFSNHGSPSESSHP